MKIILLQILILWCYSTVVFGQWQQSEGTIGLNIQSLLTNGIYHFAGGQTGVYLSTDSAASYLPSNNGNDDIGPTRCFTKDNDYVYTCTSQGAYRSDDNGATWISISSGLTNLLGSGILKVDTRLYYVGPTGVFISSDQGGNWISAGLSTTDVRCITAINDTLFIGTNGSGIYKSVDFGQNWISINNGLGSSTNFRALESQGNILFAGGPIGTGVFRSSDHGENWTLLTDGLAVGSYRGFASNSQIIVAGSFGAGVFYSTDYGDNWTAINSGLTDLSIFDLELNETHIIAATNTQGVFKYAISNINLPSSMPSFHLKNSISIFPNPTDNEINLTTDHTLIGCGYSIYDKSGKFLQYGKVTSQNTIISLDNLPSGMFLLKMNDYFQESFSFMRN